MLRESLPEFKSNDKHHNLTQKISILTMATIALIASGCGSSKSSKPSRNINTSEATQPNSETTNSNIAPPTTTQPANNVPNSLNQLSVNLCQNSELSNLAYQILDTNSTAGSCIYDNSTYNMPDQIQCNSNKASVTEWLAPSTNSSNTFYPGILLCMEPNLGGALGNRWQAEISNTQLGVYSISSQKINDRKLITYTDAIHPNSVGITYLAETYDGPYFLRAMETNVPKNTQSEIVNFLTTVEDGLL